MPAPSGATPRIEPLPQNDLRALAGRIGGTAGQTLANAAGPLAGRPVLNVLATIGNHPGLLSDLLPLLSRLGQGLLPPRDREITILRVAHHTRSPYEWAHHVLIGAAAGLTAEEISRIADGPAHPGWDNTDGTLLRAVDELHDDGAIAETTWEHLGAPGRPLLPPPTAGTTCPDGDLHSGRLHPQLLPGAPRRLARRTSPLPQVY
ncbi:carboxymuconolactone decarboxylase family protein [Streptomyces sp. NPDC048644]|uniref:carboxymuconolactone decarboxylase family protein n=1 Tax=Streptomyces sp. NPDC048644 TaxID=3365582 RepID=UPI00371820DE